MIDQRDILNRDMKIVRDFGAGLTIDELIGMSAWHIHALKLPPGDYFQLANRAAEIMVKAEFESCVLAELWGDGHSVWHNLVDNQPVVVTPTGQVIVSQP